LTCSHMARATLLAWVFHSVAPSGVLAQQRGDSLRPLTRCGFADGLRTVGADRTPADIHERYVMTARGAQAVSLADGYRVMLAYPGSDFFANLKVERSEDARYPDDKRAVVAHMEYMATRSSEWAGVSVPLEHRTHKGLDLYSIDWHTIDFYIPNNPVTLGGGPIGTYVLFEDARRLIVTVYFLNQRPERRRFQTIEEYRVLRDRFLESYTTCLGALERAGRAARPRAAGQPPSDTARVVPSVVAATDVYAQAVLDSPPATLRCPTPSYPDSLRRAGVQGRVMLELVIDTLGRPEPGSMRVRATPHDSLSRAAIQAVLLCEFAPGRLRDHAVRTLVSIPFDFKSPGP